MRHLLASIAALVGTLCAQVSHAENEHSFRLSYAKSSETDFVTVVVGDFQQSQESNGLLGATWGRPLSDTFFGLPFPMTAHIGVQHFDERGHQKDGYGATAFVKAHYDWRLPFTQTRVKVGLGEGLSYVSRIPVSEQRDFAKKGVESEKLLNYMEWTIDLPLTQFTSMKPLFEGHIEEFSVGFIVWHRSSVFGLMAESQGGVNFMGFGFEAKY